ncbi:hypothetical protein [Solicola sp. PLA-1-18]|uniref:hypothetical protein n=1 Tax=Solicola sp. PLA-1-18 TaxID=3380532 RepID=UPI003B7C160A
MSDVELHRLAVGRALCALGLGGHSLPEVVLDARLGPETRLSAVLVLLVAVEDEARPDPVLMLDGYQDDGLDWLGRRRHPWEELARLRLPWTAPTAAIAVESVTRAGIFDDRRFALALRGAREVCDAGRAEVLLVDALAHAIDRLDAVGDEHWRIKDMRGLARRALAAAAPPELLDLSLLVDGDEWVGPARDAVRDLDPAQVVPLVRALCALSTRKPSRRWLDQVELALEPAPARELLRRWLQSASIAGVVPEWPGSRIGDCLGTLFVGTNADVVRAAAWATTRLADSDWASESLGFLARRGAAHNGAPGFPEALSLKVSSAAVDALIARDGPADLRVLSELLEDLQRRDLVKRIGATLDRRQEASQREEELRRTKARAVRQKASPVPRKARAAADSLLRHHLAPSLRAAGFVGGPRTWRRIHDVRVDVIAISAGQDPVTGDNRVGLLYGVYFDAAHPADGLSPVDRARLSHHHLDIEVHDDVFADDHPQVTDQFGRAALEAVVERFHDVVLPFLDGLSDYERVAELIETDTGIPDGAAMHSGLGSPSRSEVLGLLALAAGDRRAAVAHLQHAREAARSASDGSPLDDEAIAFWTDRLHRARQLP